MFIKLRNDSVWNKNNSNNTMIKNYGDKIIHTLLYLECCTTKVGMVHFNIEEFITSCGMKVDNHEGCSVDQFRNILLILQQNDIISDIRYGVRLEKVKTKEMIVCQFNMIFNKDEKGNDLEFYCIEYDNYAKILDCDIKNKINLINVYCYIISRMRRGSLTDIDDLQKSGGSAECVWIKEETIAKELCITKNTVIKCINKLIELKLLYKDNLGQVVKEGSDKKQNAVNIYVVNPTHMKDGLKENRTWYEAQNYIILNKKLDKDFNKINGLKGQIQKQKNNGSDTTKLEESLQNKQKRLQDKLQNKQKNSKLRDNAEEYKNRLDDDINNNSKETYNGYNLNDDKERMLATSPFKSEKDYQEFLNNINTDKNEDWMMFL